MGGGGGGHGAEIEAQALVRGSGKLSRLNVAWVGAFDRERIDEGGIRRGRTKPHRRGQAGIRADFASMPSSQRRDAPDQLASSESKAGGIRMVPLRQRGPRLGETGCLEFVRGIGWMVAGQTSML
jgi:hypothetical protein